MRASRSIIPILMLALVIVPANGQNSDCHSLLPEHIMDLIIGEASGETAMKHIIEMGAYNHDRAASEYSGNFSETDYVISQLQKYGLDDITVNRYPGGSYWDGISGELWEVSPGTYKIADYHDLTAMVARGSMPCDLEAELVWVGEGSIEEIEKADVKGKIVVSSGSPNKVHLNAVEKGALGLVSFYSPRPLKVNLAIPVTGIGSRNDSEKNTTFAFLLPPREGILLQNRLLRGEKIRVHAKIESQILDYQLEVPSCLIQGSNPDAGEIILSAHLFEGYVKQGANDNISGSAALIEVARMLRSMIDDGSLEKPERGIRFIWIPEFSGTIPYVRDKKEQIKNTLCNINLDMVGLNLSKSQSFLCLQRTTYGNAHYVNDVLQNYFDFVGTGNREALAISGRDGFIKRIVAPSGTDDPFYYSIEDHYGSSDHEVFNDPSVRVPGVMLITWPDLYYHTSQDRADKCDPTQMKRVCVITAASAYTIASAGNELAVKIGSEITGNSSARIGRQLKRATDLVDSSDKDNFIGNWKKGHRYIDAAILNEVATLKSVNELGLKDPAGYIFNNEKSIKDIGRSLLTSYDYYCSQKAKELGLGLPDYRLSIEEQEAETIVPHLTVKLLESGYGSARGILRSSVEAAKMYPVERGTDINEILRLVNGTYSVFDIKIMLDGQIKKGENNLQSLINLMKILSMEGYIEY